VVPELKPGDVVIWDNLKPHKSEEAIEAIEATRARVESLTPWSPDLTPIEELVSKVKGAMRSAAARTTNTVYWAFASALDQLTLNVAVNGYWMMWATSSILHPSTQRGSARRCRLQRKFVRGGGLRRDLAHSVEIRVHRVKILLQSVEILIDPSRGLLGELTNLVRLLIQLVYRLLSADQLRLPP
jgi:hypothetical protein